jgi:signal transduction histidine kinase
VLEIGRILRREAPLEDGLAAVAERVRAALGAERVGLVVGSLPGEPAVAAAPVPVGLHPASAAALALSSGRPMSARDLEADPRVGASGPAAPSPVRGLVLPLDAGAGPLGALAIERSGDLPASARAAAEELAMHLALAVDNVRLTLRQRRSAEDLEDKVRAATERLRELDRAKSDFLSVVAHELRTPLTALEGFSELLLSRALPPERVTRFLGHLHGEARRLGRIVAELLDLSRIESGRPLQLRREELDLGELIERNVELFAAEHRGHRFEWLLDPAAPRLSADPDALDRILKNLLSNAVKYSPGGGRIAVSAGPAPDHPGMIELSVEDDGVGIPASHLPHIFERYVRVPDPRTAAARGLGLGLSLVRALAEGHGGRVEVESLPGKGSKFRLFLPG